MRCEHVLVAGGYAALAEQKYRRMLLVLGIAQLRVGVAQGRLRATP